MTIDMRVGMGVAAALIVTNALSAGAQERAAKRAVCTGNEPFWRLEMEPGSALLTRPGEAEVVEQTLRGGFENLDFLEPPWRTWRGHATGEPARFLVATMRAETCFDSMSGKEFDHRAVVSFFDGRAETGCCRVVVAADAASAPIAKPTTKPAQYWTRFLPRHLPTIRTCLNGGDVPAATVTKAWPMNRGFVGVRLLSADGRRFDCVAEATGQRIDRLDRFTGGARCQPGRGDGSAVVHFRGESGRSAGAVAARWRGPRHLSGGSRTDRPRCGPSLGLCTHNTRATTGFRTTRWRSNSSATRYAASRVSSPGPIEVIRRGRPVTAA